ncbi:MAG: type III-B CRISPR module RAMP protein Cmr1 [Fimbriimonadales bacterium]
MRRSIIDAPKWQEPSKREAIELELELITPMFGGGYKTREVDPVLPIRPAAIRGHLRFWWRATAGAQHTDAQSLYRAEANLWGGAAGQGEASAGKVAIQVEVINQGKITPYKAIAPVSKSEDGPLHGYFLFPFREQGNTPAAKGLTGVKFRLKLVLDASLSAAEKQSVKNALKAWITFGGVGARTRRGCGALKVTGAHTQQWLPPIDPKQRLQWLNDLLPKGSSKPAALTSLLGAQCVFITIPNDPLQLWRELGGFWARFRKGHFNGNYQPMKGGKWGDYRKVLCQLSKSESTLRLAKPYLGLPIVYQKLTGADFHGTLEPAESGRMASPVILKPVAFAGSSIGGLIAVLTVQPPTGIKINGKTYTLEPPSKGDHVLAALGANSVLEAVVMAAQKHFGNKVSVCTVGRQT